jgi:glycosyltransferase involved in cell wall biosynthesis
MRILFITDNFPPEVNAPATRTFEHCREWLKQGVGITVITCVPNFPHGKVYKGYKNKFLQKENFDGIEVLRVWSYITSNSGFTKRIIDYLSFAFMAFWIGIFRNYDVIIATSPQFFTTWSAWALSKIRRKPWIFELRDLWPESIKTVGAMKEGKAINILEKIELGLYKDADKVVALTDAFKTNLINRGIGANNIEVVTNGSNRQLFSPREKDVELLKRFELEGKFVIGYIGTHGMAHSLDFIVKSLAHIKDKNIHFLFIGDGAMKAKVVEIANKLKLDNITFYPPVSKDEVPRYMSIINVSLAPLKKEDNFKTVIPSKIFEASAMKKPTLLGVEGQAQEIIEKYNAGLCFEPENAADFIKKIEEIRNLKQYKKLQEGCLLLANRFDRKVLANKMLNIIKLVAE